MKITTEHPASSYGIPVILDDDGNPTDYADGVKLLRDRLGLNTAELGATVGVSRRTVENWEQGRNQPSAPALKLMADLIPGKPRARKP